MSSSRPERRPAVVRAFACLPVLAALVAGCSPPAKAPPPPPPVPLHLEPACDLAPAAGLGWLADIRPRAIASIPDLIPALGLVFPEERLKQFTNTHGGIDLRQIQDLCVARYKSETLLTIANVPLDNERVAKAFESRVLTTTASRTFVTPNPRVLRLHGEVDGEPQALLVFGTMGVALEQGKPGILRATEAFAFGKLKRAAPALRSTALARALELLGEAPVRVLAPGPFAGDTAKGLGGLLAAATAVGGSVRWTGEKSDLAVRFVVTGAWGDDAPAAKERLGAALQLLAESPAGRLFGLQHPVRGPEIRVEDQALVLDATLDGNVLARGVHDAVDAEIADIMRGAPKPAPTRR